MLKGQLAAVSNRADWVETINIPEKPVVTEAEFRVHGCGADIVKTLSAGISYDEGNGVLVVTVPEAECRNLAPGTYEVGCRVKIAGAWTGLIVASTVAVLDGVVK